MSSLPAQKVALVTGAGSGIGLAVARQLAKDGFTIVATGRRTELLDALVAEIQAAGGKALAVTSDVRDPASVDALFQTVEKECGRLDVLFNNAGIGAPAVPMDELPVEKWLDVVNTNITGVFLCARAAFGLRRRQSPQGGRIINNGSISAHTPRPYSSPYTASKHAVLGLTKCLALDGRPFNIVGCQIDIGNALTDLAARMGKGEGVRQANGTMSTEPLMDVKHVAEAVSYMAGLPLTANVLNMTVMASNMPFAGRG